MGDVAAGDGAELLGEQCRHGHCLSGQRHKLHFVAFAFAVNVDDGADVACFKAFLWDVLREDHALVFFNHNAAGNFLGPGSLRCHESRWCIMELYQLFRCDWQ